MFHRGITMILLLVACFFNTNGVYGLNITDCGSEDFVKIHEISVSFCEEEDLCPLIRGNTTILTITFEVDSMVKNLTALVHGTINDGNTFLPFPYKHHVACKADRGLTCPLMPGKTYTYTTPVEIKTLFPKVRSVVKFELREKKKVIICILIPSIVIDP